MDEKVLMAALAGLLHDVGKVEQRAKDDPWNPPQDARGSGQPVHAAWSIRVADLVPQKYKAAALAGAYHHHPQASPAQDQYLSKLVALADKLSAGERSDLTEKYKTKKPPQQLVSIFDRILQDGNNRLAEHYLPVAPLSLDAVAAYVDSEKQPAENTRDQYDDLRLALETAVKQDIQDGETYLEHVLAEMQRLTWCVPSAYYHSIADVSLYDHSRMTAALAVCMADFPETEIDRLLLAVREAFGNNAKTLPDTSVALLVGGDISGVQHFIYTIASKGAAKTLRGRSFYLQLLTEAALRFVLYRLELPYSNVIYSGGGNFFLLAPVSAGEKLPAVRAELSRILLKNHGTALYLALGSAEVPASGFRPGKLPQHWDAMHKAINAAKQQRYSELDAEMYAQVFALPSTGGNPQETCSVCGDDQRKTTALDDTEAQKRICSLCDSFDKEIGKKLPDAKFVVLGWQDPQPRAGETAADALTELGMTFQFSNEAAKIQVSAKRATVWALDDPVNGKYPQLNIPAAHILRYTANQVPPKTLDEMQKETEGGFQKLGVIRMDVDNVGEMFKHGLGDQATLSRIAALSFQLSLFFEGWIKRICERNGRKEIIYTVYTGGDDVFLIGPWDVMPVLAQEIAGEFGKYTASHPKITISAGMSFIGGKYPIYQAAEDAHNALEEAKKLPGKDAFHFLGKSWKWAVFGKLAEKQEQLGKIVGRDKDDLEGPQAIIQTLRQLAQDAELHSKGKSRHVWGRWIWLGTYQLKRMAERAKGKSELAAQIEAVSADLQNENYQNIDQWGTAARWAQLKKR